MRLKKRAARLKMRLIKKAGKCVLASLFLAPPSLKTIAQYYRVAVPFRSGTWLTLETDNEPLEKLFDELYKKIIILGLNPNQIVYEVEPYNIDDWMKAWELSNKVMRAL